MRLRDRIMFYVDIVVMAFFALAGLAVGALDLVIPGLPRTRYGRAASAPGPSTADHTIASPTQSGSEPGGTA